MKKNENIFISLQIRKDQESKGLLLNVQFDQNAPNFSIENETITWCPTNDEIDFIAEAFELIGGYKGHSQTTDEEHTISERPSETNTRDPPRRSSEMRIAPLVEEPAIEVTTDSESSPSKKNTDDKIFVQADEKTIDEVLKRKKPAIGEDYGIESGDKTLIDRMLKQKRRKE